MNDAEIRVVQAQIIALLKANPDNRAIKVTMIPEIASLFVDFLHDFDPRHAAASGLQGARPAARGRDDE